MKTIQLQIDDNNYESFLNIIQNLKDGFIKSFKVINDEKEVPLNKNLINNEDSKSKFNS